MAWGMEREALTSILASNPRVGNVALDVYGSVAIVPVAAGTAGNTLGVEAKP